MFKVPILFEDLYLLIIDKPAGLIVHEGAGNINNIKNQKPKTKNNGELLTDWIKVYKPEVVTAFQDEKELYFRPGIVHRLDKGTSGLLVLAKTPSVKHQLLEKFKNRKITKEYTALVLGKPAPEEGSIETFIARDPHHRRQMAVNFVGKGKAARTDYKVTRTWQYHYKGQSKPISLLNIVLHSGRMHQIRVHLKHKGWPVLGDQTYQTKVSRNLSRELGLDRQFLHAKRLAFEHPVTHEPIDEANQIPTDLQNIIDKLNKEAVSWKLPFQD